MNIQAPQRAIPSTVMATALPPDLAARVRAAVTDMQGMRCLITSTAAEARARLAAGELEAAPEVLVVGYSRREAWSVRTLLSGVLSLPGMAGTTVLLVAEGPRYCLPVCLTDDPRVDVVEPRCLTGRLIAGLPADVAAS